MSITVTIKSPEIKPLPNFSNLPVHAAFLDEQENTLFIKTGKDSAFSFKSLNIIEGIEGYFTVEEVNINIEVVKS